MLTGDFAALDVGCMMICVPIFTVIFNRRCVQIEDGIGIFLALVGIILVTRPTFIFGGKDAGSGTPVLAYVPSSNGYNASIHSIHDISLFPKSLLNSSVVFFRYLLALYAGIPSALVGFIVGLFPHVHWSSYITLRTQFQGLASLVFLMTTEGWRGKTEDSISYAHSRYDFETTAPFSSNRADN